MVQDKTEPIEFFLDHAIDHATKQDADLIIVYGTESLENQIRFSQNKIDINKQWRSDELQYIIAVDGDRLATGIFSPTSETHLRSEIDNAIKFARKIEPSPLFKGVEDDSTKRYPAIDRLYDSRIDDFMVESPELVNSAIDMAINSGSRRVAGFLVAGKRKKALISSAGPKGEFSFTYYHFYVRAFQDILDESGQGFTSGCTLDRVSDEFQKTGERAGTFSKAHQGCVQGKPGTYDLILSPAVAANILGGAVALANPLYIMMGRSPFQDKVGEQLAPDYVQVHDNGILDDGLQSAPFDSEGSPCQNTPIIKNGILVGFIHNTSSARLLGAETTGNSKLAGFYGPAKFLAPVTTNLEFAAGDHDFDGLLEGLKPAIYVTGTWYSRMASFATTDFSSIPRDAMFYVENGELGQPIKNIRISDNVLRMMRNITAASKERQQAKWFEDTFPTLAPHIRIRDCRITTATK
ncbi:MAG: TldD/PmbA family protein [Candidatus Hodarchaeales archaeon]|jgi:PmbA protein